MAQLNGIHKLLLYADVNMLGRNIHIIKKNTEVSVVTSKEIGPEVNADKSMYLQKQTEVRECLLSFGAESFVLVFIQEHIWV
jgi:hypothetical protein